MFAPLSWMQQVRGGVSPSRGNASQIRASLPQVTVEQDRRELVAFYQECWQFTNFKHNKGKVGILPLMVRLLIDTYRTLRQSINQAVWEENSPARRLRNMSQCVRNQVEAQVQTDVLMNSQKRWRTKSSKQWKCGWMEFWQKILSTASNDERHHFAASQRWSHE